MNIKRKLRKELSAIDTPPADKILPNMPSSEKRVKRQIRFVPVLAVILCVAIISCTAFAAPAIIKLFNAGILSGVTQLDEVPDGYVGIYTVDDLDNIRYADPYTNYILMNDIDLTDRGEWTPIHSFGGIFNGNGYVIRNLKIVGNESAEKLYFGLFGDTNGHFINTGIEGCTISVSFAEAPVPTGEHVCVGALAASATFVGGCYATDTVIDVSLENFDIEADGGSVQTLSVGTIAGITNYMDSCHVDAHISISDGTSFTLNAGLCAGSAFSCITSYSIGEITVSGNAWSTVKTHGVAVVSAGAYMPTVLNDTAMKKLCQALDEHYDDGKFTSRKIQASFIKHYPDESNDVMVDRYFEANQSFGYVSGDITKDAEWYFLDVASSRDELDTIQSAVSEAFGSYESFCEFCIENGIKCGMMYCYHFERNEAVTKNELSSFDFDNIWTEKDGKVMLRIFNG